VLPLGQIVREEAILAKQRVSGKQAYTNFQEVFRSAYRPKTDLLRESIPAIKSAGLQTDSVIMLGHPDHVDLQPGQTRLANAAISFIDIRGFTKLSFALSSSDLLRLVQALTEASIKVITDGGGYIGEFTGDGVMAYFGDFTSSSADAVTSATETTSVLFKTVEEIVNPELKSQGLDPIRIGAGIEFGEILWSRIGVGAASQVKPIGTATFLAGKLCSSRFTAAWECKVGSEFARWVPDEYLTKTSQYGPVTVNGKSFSRDLYLLNWRQVSTDALVNEAKLQKAMANRAALILGGSKIGTGTKITDPPKPGGPSPRPLKDQPFFGS
jgi:class 3 adenylate cyclase